MSRDAGSPERRGQEVEVAFQWNTAYYDGVHSFVTASPPSKVWGGARDAPFGAGSAPPLVVTAVASQPLGRSVERSIGASHFALERLSHVPPVLYGAPCHHSQDIDRLPFYFRAVTPSPPGRPIAY